MTATKKVELKDLTPEAKKALLVELAAEERNAKVHIESERKVYKELSSKSVDDVFPSIVKVHNEMSLMKGKVFRTFMSLVDMKVELYEVKKTQQSHTFMNAAGDKKVRIGYRVYDRYDDTKEAGIEKIYTYLGNLATDAGGKELMKAVDNLLKRDEAGNLKPGRVIELIKMAQESNSPLFKDGVEIIKEAHYFEQSAYYVEAEYKDENGNWHNVGLSVSSVDFSEADKKAIFKEDKVEK